MTPANDDIAAIEAALAPPGWLQARGTTEEFAINPARLRRVLDTMAQMASALETLLPMVEEWHEEFPHDAGDAEAPVIEAARATLALYRGTK